MGVPLRKKASGRALRSRFVFAKFQLIFTRLPKILQKQELRCNPSHLVVYRNKQYSLKKHPNKRHKRRRVGAFIRVKKQIIPSANRYIARVVTATNKNCSRPEIIA